MTYFRILLAVGVADFLITSGVAAQYNPRLTLHTTALRERASQTAPARLRLPPKTPVTALEQCHGYGAWCHVEYRFPLAHPFVRYVPIRGWVKKTDIETSTHAHERLVREARRRTVFLYDHLDFGPGPHQRNRRESVPELPSGLDRTVSSVAVPNNVWVTFYSRKNFGGSKLHVHGPIAITNLGAIPRAIENLPNGHWNDEIRSYRVQSRRPGGIGTFCDTGGCHVYEHGIVDRAGHWVGDALGAVIRGGAWVADHLEGPTPVEDEAEPTPRTLPDSTVATFVNRLSVQLYVYTLSLPRQPRMEFHCEDLSFQGTLLPAQSMVIRVPSGQQTWVRIQESSYGEGCYESENKFQTWLEPDLGSVVIRID